MSSLKITGEGHSVPPLAACVLTVRDRDMEPPPHDAEQGDHVVQLLRLQSTAQGRVLQGCVTVNCADVGQAVPLPVAGVVILPVRV